MNYSMTQTAKVALRNLPGFSEDDSYSTLLCYKQFVADDQTRGLSTWIDYGGSYAVNVRVMPCIVEDDSWSEHQFKEAYTPEQIEHMKVLASEWLVRVKEIMTRIGIGGALIVDGTKLWQW